MSKSILQDSPDGGQRQEFHGRVKLSVLRDIVERGKAAISASLDMAVEDVVDVEVAWRLHPPEQIMRNKWQVSGYGMVVELDWCGYASSCRIVDEEDEAMLEVLGKVKSDERLVEG